MRQRVIDAFTRRHGTTPEFVVRAPGRVNLIGEHTDYNDGLVLPLAINRSVWLAGRRASDARVTLDSLDQDGTVVFTLGEAQPTGPQSPGWGRYPWAVGDLISRQDGRSVGPAGPVRPVGLVGVLGSEIPVGAGLSSSAALELATARALQEVQGEVWDPLKMSLLCHRAECEAVGVACGVMDQMVVGLARQDHALMIDCRSLAPTPIKMPHDLLVAVLDTGTRRELENSAYNDRRVECETAAAEMGLTSLRDASLETLAAAQLTGNLLRRARHVLTENQRVASFAEALQSESLGDLGPLLAESHRSLRDDFDVVTDSLDLIVNIANQEPGCLGARMTGAGFGGCAVALVERATAPAFAHAVEAHYSRQTSLSGRVHLCDSSQGADIGYDVPSQ